jgi:hypothetical protein
MPQLQTVRATSTNARNAGEMCVRLGKYKTNPGGVCAPCRD